MDSSGRKISGREFCRRGANVPYLSALSSHSSRFSLLLHRSSTPLDLDSVRFTRFELRARQTIKNLIVGAAKSIFVKIGSHLSIAPCQPRARSYSTRNVILGCNRRSRSDARVNSCGGIIARGEESGTRKRSFPYRPRHVFFTSSLPSFRKWKIRRLAVIKGLLPYICAYMCDTCVA